jgi:hypothetical protein
VVGGPHRQLESESNLQLCEPERRFQYLGHTGRACGYNLDRRLCQPETGGSFAICTGGQATYEAVPMATMVDWECLEPVQVLSNEPATSITSESCVDPEEAWYASLLADPNVEKVCCKGVEDGVDHERQD